MDGVHFLSITFPKKPGVQLLPVFQEVENGPIIAISARHLQSPKLRNPDKIHKFCREEFGTTRPWTPKKFTKNQKRQEIVDSNHQLFFLTFGHFLELFGGSGWGGLSGPLRLRVQSRSRTRLRIAASIAFLFRACFKGVLDTIAPLSRG